MTGISASGAFTALVRRDLALAYRQGGAALQAVVFFAVVVTMIPFGLGPDLALLQRVAPGILWVAFILASLLTLDRLFQADFEDGSLDVLVLSPLSLELVVLAKSLAHWLANALPLIVAAPVLAVMLNMHLVGLVMLTVTLAIGTLGLTFLGAMGAALTVSVRRAGLLTALLVLPLYVPILIFGVGAVAAAERAQAAGQGIEVGEANLLLLTAVSLIGFVVGPFAAAAGLRLHLE